MSEVNVTCDAACICSHMSVLFLQVAIIAGNFDLAEIIKVHKSSDVGKLNWDAPAEQPSGEVDERVKKAERL